MVKLKRIGVLSAARLQGALMAFVGLIAGILYSFGGAFYELFTGTLNPGTVLAFGALIGMPVVFAVSGFVSGAVVAFLYNLAAGWIGGIDVDLEDV
jgi:hypothetical protein